MKKPATIRRKPTWHNMSAGIVMAPKPTKTRPTLNPAAALLSLLRVLYK
ncbi:MAG: hypothetical protein QXR45_04985 [Candidatus Bathyarchaeia archaeon]